MLWDDQVEYAQTLRDKRKTYSTGLLVIAGLGLFRLEWYRHAHLVPVISSPWVDVTLRLLLTMVAVVFVMAAYFMYTERRGASLGCRWVGRFRLFGWVRRSAEWVRDRVGLRDYEASHGEDIEEAGSKRAIAVLEMSAERIDEFVRAQTWAAWQYRTVKLQLAYRRLVDANDRVNRRIRLGLLPMGTGYTLLIALFVLCFWGINR
ncbi:MAG TPA: hypothetical protein DEB06_09305 [Phycisphaerales bacterium]|nr:hypothetical protein [Phycisphaerales bacterium]